MIGVRRGLVLGLLLVMAVIGLATGTASAQADSSVTADNFEVMLVVDTSGSMRDAMPMAQQAAIGFINQMPANVRVGLVSFGSFVTVGAPPTADRALLTAAINGLVAVGNTRLYDGVIAAANSFTPAAAHKAIVLLSDGKDTHSANALPAAVSAAQGAHVEAISLTESNLVALQAFGTVTPAEDPAGLSAAFTRVGDLLTKVVIPSTVATAPTTAATTVPATTAAPKPAPTTVPVTTPAPTTAVAAPPAPASADAEGSSTDPRLWVGVLGVFAALFLLTLLVWPRQRVSKARLGIHKPKTVSSMGARTSVAVEDFLERHGKRGELAMTLSVANIAMAPGDFLTLVAVIALVLGLVALVLIGPLAAVVVFTVVCSAVRISVRRRKTKRQVAFAEQLPDVLQSLTTSLRSGFGVMQALDSVAEEVDEPARSELAHVLVETRLGRDLSDALRSLSERMDNQDLDWVVGAIDINRDTGGNLSEVLEQVSATVRERQRMKRQVRTFTAEGRMSARILTAMPFVMVLWQWLAKPDDFGILLRGAGLALLVGSAVLLLIGWLWVNRIVHNVES